MPSHGWAGRHTAGLAVTSTSHTSVSSAGIQDQEDIPRLGTASGRKKVLFLHRVFPYWVSPWFLGSVYDWRCRPDQQGPRSKGCGSSSVLLEW